MATETWYVYLLECSNKRIYTGVSPDVDARIRKHQFGKGALFTKINKPERLLAQKAFSSKREALQVEQQIKKMPAEGKRLLADLWLKAQSSNTLSTSQDPVN
ncbi:MAG: GIY-YIG nuclease family protein [Alishewanella aestuarii]